MGFTTLASSLICSLQAQSGSWKDKQAWQQSNPLCSSQETNLAYFVKESFCYFFLTFLMLSEISQKCLFLV